ncbi:hypothetical protein J2D73_16660 [Acetobacter sacchari]|uniref:Uncharacterized protein n=1 Tax=Acetobacter sacchari TaxID=2661687 RepID=A0ABS3LZU0_9PROT|nr:hypothetical protein [Acetobacter sacchari]MBO1361418.1 hypothetical protein [Acetobacter sacchari]
MPETIGNWNDLHNARLAAEPAINAMAARLAKEAPPHVVEGFAARRRNLSYNVANLRSMQGGIGGTENAVNLKNIAGVFRELRSDVARWESLPTAAIVREIDPPPPPPPSPPIQAKTLVEQTDDMLDAWLERGIHYEATPDGKVRLFCPAGVKLEPSERELINGSRPTTIQRIRARPCVPVELVL